jgi:hypothetical protein
MKLLVKSDEQQRQTLIAHLPGDLECLIKSRLVPVLLENLCEQRDLEEEEDQQLTPFKSACICLMLCVAHSQESLVDSLTRFLNKSIELENRWQCIDAGLIALGALFKLRDLGSVKDSLEEKLNILNSLLASHQLDDNIFINNEAIRDTCECLIYFICQTLPEYCHMFEGLSEVRMRTFKFFLFNKNLLLDWSDSFKVKFNRNRRYKVDLRELATREADSDVLSIASSVCEWGARPQPVIVIPPKQPMIT